MIIHELIQGSSEWLAHRSTHFNASDAPAMMGVSPYKTRTQLLHELHTGVVKEVDAGTQRRFDDGHRFEALARPLAEKIIGQDLYPITGSEGKLSASFDGLTMDESVGFEHKSLNDELRRVMVEGCTGADLGIDYQIQMEQQCLVSGAERELFVASKWQIGADTGEYELVEERHCWYTPNLELRQRIIDGWTQFEKDLAAYVPVEVVEKPRAEVIKTLPALAIQIRGEVVLSNLPDFKEAAEKYIAEIKTDLKDDTDFANAEATVKFCEKAEKDLELTKSAAIAQTASIDELMRTIDHIQSQLRDKRLMLDKLVTKRKAEIKDGIVLAAKRAYADHLNELNSELKPITLSLTQPDFAGAAKNKRTLASLQDAVDSELAASKIAADNLARELRSKKTWIAETTAGAEFLFNDLQTIIYKSLDDLKLLVLARKNEYETKKATEDAAKAQSAIPVPAHTVVSKPNLTAVPSTLPTQATAEIPSIRQELYDHLRQLGDKEIERVLNFVKSRYPIQSEAA